MSEQLEPLDIKCTTRYYVEAIGRNEGEDKQHSHLYEEIKTIRVLSVVFITCRCVVRDGIVAMEKRFQYSEVIGARGVFVRFAINAHIVVFRELNQNQTATKQNGYEALRISTKWSRTV